MHDIEADIQSGTEAVDAIVLGAGISGLVSASILLNQGYQRVLIVDEYDHVGGNHIDVQIGEYTFDIRALFFRTIHRYCAICLSCCRVIAPSTRPGED